MATLRVVQFCWWHSSREPEDRNATDTETANNLPERDEGDNALAEYPSVGHDSTKHKHDAGEHPHRESSHTLGWNKLS